MATQPQPHSILPTDHVTTNPQTIPLNYRDPATTPSPNTHPHSNVFNPQNHPSSPTKLDKSAPHLSAPDTVVTSHPLSPPIANQYLSTTSHSVTETTSSQNPSPPKRRKIEILPPHFPNSTLVVDALSTSISPSQLLPPSSALPTAEHPNLSHALDTQHSQSLSQFPNKNPQHNSPETGSTEKPSVSDNTSPECSSTNPIHESSMHTENLLTSTSESAGEIIPNQHTSALSSDTHHDQTSSIRCVTYPSSFSTKPVNVHLNNRQTETDSAFYADALQSSLRSSSLPFIAFHNVMLPTCRKRVNPSSFVPTSNDDTFADSHAGEPHTKRLKSDQDKDPPMSSTSSIESTSMTSVDSEGQNREKKEPDTMKVDVSNAKPSQNAKSPNVAGTLTTGASLPLLRSIPVLLEPRDRVESRPLESKSDVSDLEMQNALSPQLKYAMGETKISQEQQTPGKGQPNASSPQRKKKSVSWAPEDKLVDVQFIDNRMELVRSWDADFQVTLPFAPNTLQMFQQALKEQDAAKRNKGQSDGKGAESVSLRSMPKLTSFEEARKREHDMEQERARQAREELKERLNAMAPSAPWRAPIAIVLPAECRIEEESVERFDLAGADCPDKVADGDLRSPPSPPHQCNESYDASRRTSTNVPSIPLSDRFAQNGDGEFESVATTSGIDSREYLHPEGGQNYFRENGDRMRSNEDSGADLKASSGSFSKEYKYSDSRNNAVGSCGVDLRCDSRNNSRGQFVQNEYSDSNPTPSPSQAHTVQHLLSALQSSGLLKQGNAMVNTKNNSADYEATSKCDNGSSTSDGSYRECQQDEQGEQGEQGEMRSHDGSERYENDTRENDGRQKESVVEKQSMGAAEGNMGTGMMGRSMGGPFAGGIQQAGMMDMMHFPSAMGPPPMGMPPIGLGGAGGIGAGPIPPPPMGMPPPPLGMLQMLGVPMPLMSIPAGMQMNDNNQSQSGTNNGRSGGGGGRGMETISRPKQKPMKQRKRCKYFGTKQGCRDGSSCMFAHN